MLKELFSYMKQYKKYAWISLACIAVECIFELVIPLIMADMVDVGIANGDQDYILHKGLVMIGCAGLALVLGICSARFCALCGQGFGANLREAEYRKLQSYSFSNIDHFQVSSLVTRLTSDVTVIQNSVSTGIRPLCRAPVMLFMATGSAFVINARLALVFLVALPVLGFLLFEIVSHVGPLYTKMQTGIDRVNRIVQENLTAVRVVRSYVRENYEQAKFDDANLALRTESEKAFGLSSMNMAAMQFVMYGTILAILWFGGSSIRTGTMQVGELTGFLSYVLQILNSLMMLSNVFMMLTRSMASGARILEVLNEKVEITEEKARPVSVKKGAIRFDHVFFQYSKNAEVCAFGHLSESGSRTDDWNYRADWCSKIDARAADPAPVRGDKGLCVCRRRAGAGISAGASAGCDRHGTTEKYAVFRDGTGQSPLGQRGRDAGGNRRGVPDRLCG